MTNIPESKKISRVKLDMTNRNLIKYRDVHCFSDDMYNTVKTGRLRSEIMCSVLKNSI